MVLLDRKEMRENSNQPHFLDLDLATTIANWIRKSSHWKNRCFFYRLKYFMLVV